ncbi:hypothetical protein BKA81DRAFT_356846 [Phyllosticta paracitricarpa]|uniref:Uncharacterized protein n=1 Tax=Phyllosticta citricarpa TaxID=55181 RepID=A0ABR1ML34_9PEZI
MSLPHYCHLLPSPPSPYPTTKRRRRQDTITQLSKSTTKKTDRETERKKNHTTPNRVFQGAREKSNATHKPSQKKTNLQPPKTAAGASHAQRSPTTKPQQVLRRPRPLLAPTRLAGLPIQNGEVHFPELLVFALLLGLLLFRSRANNRRSLTRQRQ